MMSPVQEGSAQWGEVEIRCPSLFVSIQQTHQQIVLSLHDVDMVTIQQTQRNIS